MKDENCSGFREFLLILGLLSMEPYSHAHEEPRTLPHTCGLAFQGLGFGVQGLGPKP